jgi:hypothetical protein
VVVECGSECGAREEWEKEERADRREEGALRNLEKPGLPFAGCNEGLVWLEAVLMKWMAREKAAVEGGKVEEGNLERTAVLWFDGDSAKWLLERVWSR